MTSNQIYDTDEFLNAIPRLSDTLFLFIFIGAWLLAVGIIRIKLLSRVFSVLSLGFIAIGLVLPSALIPSLAIVATIDTIAFITLAIYIK